MPKTGSDRDRLGMVFFTGLGRFWMCEFSGFGDGFSREMSPWFGMLTGPIGERW